jgi:hypothetical protein
MSIKDLELHKTGVCQINFIRYFEPDDGTYNSHFQLRIKQAQQFIDVRCNDFEEALDLADKFSYFTFQAVEAHKINGGFKIIGFCKHDEDIQVVENKHGIRALYCEDASEQMTLIGEPFAGFPPKLFSNLEYWNKKLGEHLEKIAAWDRRYQQMLDEKAEIEAKISFFNEPELL